MANKSKIILFLVLVYTGVFLFSAEEKTRHYLTTISWYPASRDALESMLGQYFEKAKVKKIPGKLVGLIAPHAGIVFSGQCAANAYKQLASIPDVNRVIMLGISHGGRFYGACVSDFDYNATPLGKIPVDKKITARLGKEKNFRVDNRLMQDEHSLENHLPFLQRALKNRAFKIVPILFGYLQGKDFESMANTIKKYVDEKTLVIASTDFTHYGENFAYTPFKSKKDIKNELTKLDMGMINRILKLDFDSYTRYMKDTGITMCGFVPVGVLIKIFSDNKHKGLLMDYYKSGDSSNDYSLSVSYASIIITENQNPNTSTSGIKQEATRRNPMDLSKEEKKTLLGIARKSLEEYLGNEKLLEDIEKTYQISEKLKQKTGVFVTLKIRGHLRGCIGSIVGTTPLYLGVRDSAIKSGLNDPRFMPVKKEELKKIDIEISVMTPLQRIDDYKKIRLGTDGVIIKKGYYQAVYLPQVATETGWNLDQFLGSLCEKAGLPAYDYKSPEMEFHIFQALVFGEKELEKGK